MCLSFLILNLQYITIYKQVIYTVHSIIIIIIIIMKEQIKVT